MDDRKLFGQFTASLKQFDGIEIRICPKCSKTTEKKVKYTKLDEYAFKDGVLVTFNGRGCCY
jgi:hypothetical protein